MTQGTNNREWICPKCQRKLKKGGGHPLVCGTERNVIAFWKRVDKNGPGGCWLYTGFRKWDGYGWLARVIDGRQRYLTAHRYAWILAYGKPPEGAEIMHKCDVPACCNPAHLRLGTHDENMKDCKSKGRQNSGALKKYKPLLYPDRVRPRKVIA